MAHVVLITGGSRSGKSRTALQLMEELPAPRVFLATCPHVDEEMDTRIRHHQEQRRGRGWATVEETVDLAEALRSAPGEAVLVDCLTLWMSNLMFAAEQKHLVMDEDDAAAAGGRVLEVCRDRKGTVVLVTNEVGMGVVPEHALGRRFRDLAGRCNQIMAAGADEVIFMVSGLPLRLKP